LPRAQLGEKRVKRKAQSRIKPEADQICREDVIFSTCNSEPFSQLVKHIIKANDTADCGLVVRVLGYRSGGPGSIPGTTRKRKVVGLERSPLSLVSTTKELLDRKVADPV
jgi:hypothetical protein